MEAPATENAAEFLQHRLDKLARWREAGIDPYPYRYDATHRSDQLKADFDRLAESGDEVSASGRIMALRGFGKSTFVHIQDEVGQIQAYFQTNKLGADAYERVGWLDMGDIIGVKGTMFKTRTGETNLTPPTPLGVRVSLPLRVTVCTTALFAVVVVTPVSCAAPVVQLIPVTLMIRPKVLAVTI